MGALIEMNTPTNVTPDAFNKFNYQDSEVKKVVKVLTDEERFIFVSIFYVALSGLVGSLGIVGNIINIIIFYIQGFTNTVNISFIGLAASDLFCLIFVVWASICMNPLLPVVGVPWVGLEVMSFSAGWPHLTFCRITSYITVYITGERCISIVLPLKVKQIISKTRTATIICMIYVVNFMLAVPEWVTTYLGWRYVPELNKTLLAVVFTSNRKKVEGICFIFHSIISMASFFGVVVFTAVLVIKIRHNSKLRIELTTGNDKKGFKSAKDKKAVKLIVLIASILIVCYIPGAIAAMTIFVVGPEFSIQGVYTNISASVWGIAFFFQSINSSVNIFLYYRMSSKYKQTFDDFFHTIGPTNNKK